MPFDGNHRDNGNDHPTPHSPIDEEQRTAQIYRQIAQNARFETYSAIDLCQTYGDDETDYGKDQICHPFPVRGVSAYQWLTFVAY